MKKRGHHPLPSVVMTKSGASMYHHSDEHHDHLIVNSSDEEETDQDRNFEVKAMNIDKFPTAKEAMDNPYQKNEEHLYEDSN